VREKQGRGERWNSWNRRGSETIGKEKEGWRERRRSPGYILE